MALMTIVNLIAICLSGKWAVATLRDFHRQYAQGINSVFAASEAGLPGVLDGNEKPGATSSRRVARVVADPSARSSRFRERRQRSDLGVALAYRAIGTSSRGNLLARFG